MARLVNKQFNSPIGLYSEQNIREVMDRETQILANGAVGINFNNPGVGKPTNLQNSAVLRMLEEEEQRQRSGQSPSNGYSRPLRDQIKWPPPDFVDQHHQRSSFKDVVTPGLKRVAWPPPNEGENYTEQEPANVQGGPQYSSQSPTLQNNNTPSQHQPQNASQRQPLRPLDISNGTNYSQSSSPLANQSPVAYRPAHSSRPWAPVHSPVATPTQQYPAPQQYQAPAPREYQIPVQYEGAPSNQYQTPVQYQAPPSNQYQIPVQYQAPPSNQYQAPPAQQYQPLPQQYQPQNQIYSQQLPQSSVAATKQAVPYPSARQVEPPPATITLRAQAPVSQAPPPVVTSQPATATLKGGKNLRGDLKWPPEPVKVQMIEENRQRIELARGPAFRPRLVRKDYGPFFAQHALNSSYPGYKAPPGTQFYDNGEVY